MGKKFTVTITHLQRGQPRPYADSIYEADIETSEPIGDFVAKKIARALVREFDDEPKDWASAKLDVFRPSEPDRHGFSKKWRVRVTEAYTD